MSHFLRFIKSWGIKKATFALTATILSTTLIVLSAGSASAAIRVTTDLYDDIQIATAQSPSISCIGHVGKNTYIYTRQVGDSTWSRNLTARTTTGIEIAYYARTGKFYLSHTGTDGRIYTASSTNCRNWSAWNRNNAPLEATYNGVAMTAGNFLYQVHIGTNQKIYLRRNTNFTEPLRFSRWTEINVPRTLTKHAVDLIKFKDRLYMIHVGLSDQLFISSSSNGISGWSNWKQLPGRTKVTPTLSTLKDVNGNDTKLAVAHTGTDGNVYFANNIDAISWNNLTNGQLGVIRHRVTLPHSLLEGAGLGLYYIRNSDGAVFEADPGGTRFLNGYSFKK